MEKKLSPPKLVLQTKSFRVFKIEEIGSFGTTCFKFVYERLRQNTLGEEYFSPVDGECGNEVIREYAEAS